MKNQEILGTTAAELMDRLDEENDESVEIAECLIMVRIDGRDGDGEFSYVQWRGSDPVWTHQLGLLYGCLEGMQTFRLKNTLQNEDEEDE